METTKDMELVATSELIPYANNARTHSGAQVNKLRASLREFGFVNPVIIDRDKNVIAGHGRIQAALAEGIEEVPCVYADHLTDAQKKAYILADNRMALDAGWDEEMLKAEIEALYSRFGDRDAFMRALYGRAVEWVRSYNVEHSGDGCNAFSSVGLAHIRIAQQYPGIFAFVYMSPYVQADGTDQLLRLAEQPGVLQKMGEMWGMTEGQAEALYTDMAIYTHGLATLIMAGAEFADGDLKPGMNRVFYALASTMGIAFEGSGDGC